MDSPVKEPEFDNENEEYSNPEFEIENEKEHSKSESESEEEEHSKSKSENEEEEYSKSETENEKEDRSKSESDSENEKQDYSNREFQTLHEEFSLIPCNFCEIETVQKLEQILLHGLASACVERTAGDLFKGPITVSPEISKEMVEFLMEKTEHLLSETISEKDENLDQIKKAATYPTEFISDSIENFITSKRNLLSRVSGWISSETRLAKIDEVALQIAEINNFKSIAEVLLRNMDIKGNFHCPQKFSTEQEFQTHIQNCLFRPLHCKNPGCKVIFSAISFGKHDVICPYKILPCDQECGKGIARREMEEHCGVDCAMRLVNCPFYQVGCESAFPYVSLEKHSTEFVQLHLFCVLKSLERQGNHTEELKQRVQLLEKSHSLNEMSGALDQRSLTLLLKEQEAKMRKMESLMKDQESKIKKLEKELSKVTKS
ncbi:hypothetical protein LUZ60_004424 [Juncus effusus]|nr:hypothetical protein LUZ60_004424 [Juncus effusus]